MKYLLFAIIFIFSACKSYAQEKHFIFIQSESRQPFYVSLDGKIHSSTASGYVIIPKLTDGGYELRIGFAQSIVEYPFTYYIKNNDAGFSLRNFGEKGWGLFNLQTFNVLMAGEVKATAQNEVKELPPEISFNVKKETASITNAQKGEVKSGIDSLKMIDSAIVINNSAPTPGAVEVNNQAASKVQKQDSSSVAKVSQVENADDVSLKYVDKNGNATDTIDIKIVKSDAPISTSKENKEKDSLLNSLPGSENVKSVDTTLNTSVAPVAKESSLSATGCKDLATDEDYTRLRKRMAHETTDEKMLDEAKKLYRKKCFSTNQLRMLSTLFLSDEGRYIFFSESYSFVADREQFISLQKEFVDPAYVSKFQAQFKQVN
jgi:hypothetical protein